MNETAWQHALLDAITTPQWQPDPRFPAGALGSAAANVDSLLFRFFDYLPFPLLSGSVAMLLIAVFFVTSADSGAMVLDSIASGGDTASPLWQRLFWAVLLGVTAGVLLTTGGLKALQAMTLVSALPFTAIMLLLCYSLWRGLQSDHCHQTQQPAPATQFWSGHHWQQRLRQLVQRPDAFGLLPPEALTIEEIARRSETPKRFLEQILNDLKSAGLVKSKRGVAGGYRLAKRPEDITLAQVVRHLGGALAPVSCVSENFYEKCSCPDEAKCAIRSVMKEVRDAVAQIAERVTLAEMCDRWRRLNVPLGHHPHDYVI